MACTLRTDLIPTLPAGGSWTYVGYDAASAAGDYNDTPATPFFVGVAVDGAIPYGDNPTLDDDGVSLGYHRFLYTYTGGTATVTVRVVDEDECAGVDGTVTVDPTSGTAVNLFNLLDGVGCATVTAGGSWTDEDDAGAAFVAPNLTPSSLASEGTYRFTYALDDGVYTVRSCSDCAARSATITVVAEAQLDATIAETSGTCVHTISGENPDDATANQFRITLASDDFYPKAELRVIVDNCSREVSNQVLDFRSNHGIQNQCTVSFAFPLQNSGYLKTLTLSSTTGGLKSITVPLAPTTATLTGPAGTVNATDLSYNTVNGSVLAAALAKVVRNYMASISKTEGTHYFLRSVIYAAGIIYFSFRNRHDPSTEWIGLNRHSGTPDVLTYVQTSAGVDRTSNAGATGSNDATPNTVYGLHPCSSLRLQYNGILPINLTSPTDYDNLDLIDTTYDATVNTSLSTLSVTCNTKTLTVSVVNCSGSPTYLWNTGETTASIVVSSSATYSCTVTCGSDTKTVSRVVVI